MPEYLCAQVVEHGADLGLALDGDADRLLLSDEHGELIDGDQILALIARSWRAGGRLRGDGIVATVMSNLGLERFLAGAGLALHRTKVGDRYVAERMRERGMNIGGEQSGHMILSDFATTGRRSGGRAAGAGGARRSEAGRRARCAACSRRCRSACGMCASRAPRRCKHAPVQAAIADAEGDAGRHRPAADPRERHRTGGARHGRGRGRGAGAARSSTSSATTIAAVSPGRGKGRLMNGRVLVIAGSDSGGGAGIQADIKTITALGGYAATAITALTAQNTLGRARRASRCRPISSACRCECVLDDIGADAIKTGMLGDAARDRAASATCWQTRAAAIAAGGRSGHGGEGRAGLAGEWRGGGAQAPPAADGDAC